MGWTPHSRLCTSVLRQALPLIWRGARSLPTCLGANGLKRPELTPGETGGAASQHRFKRNLSVLSGEDARMLPGCHHQTKDVQTANQSPGPLPRLPHPQLLSHFPLPFPIWFLRSRVGLSGARTPSCTAQGPRSLVGPEEPGLGDDQAKKG